RGNSRGSAYPGKHIRQGLQTRRTGGGFCRVLEFRQEIIVSQEESLDGTIKNHHLHGLVRFHRSHDIFELRDIRGSKYIERWKIERDSPVAIGTPHQTYFAAICFAHIRLL